MYSTNYPVKQICEIQEPQTHLSKRYLALATHSKPFTLLGVLELFLTVWC